MIETYDISKTFWDSKRGPIHAVNPTSIKLRRSEIFGLLGPNGAGKTTLLRMLATVLTPTTGSATIYGLDLLSQSDDIKKYIGFISGNTKLYGRLSPRELLIYFGELYDMTMEEICKNMNEIFDMLDMREFADQKIERLSTGQTQKTSIARCLLHDPPILILDEPTLGLDILTARIIIEFIRSSALGGKTILFSTHYMEEAEMLCDRIALLHQGTILDVDTLEGYQEKCERDHLADIFLSYVSSKNQQIEIVCR